MNACYPIVLIAGAAFLAAAHAGVEDSAAAAAAKGESSAHFAAGSAAFSAGDYAGAAAAFEAAQEAGMAGPAVKYNMAVSYYRVGEYTRAADTFTEVAERYPEMRALAEYNLGLALLKQELSDDAHAAFERARQGGDPTIAVLAEEMLARSGSEESPAPSGPTWVKLFDLAVGYDDNVALIEESSLPVGVSTGSSLTEAFGVVSGRLGASQAVRVDASAYLVRYSSAPEFDQDALRIGVAYLWEAGAWRIDAGSHYDYSRLDGEGFERRIGASLTARYPIGAGAMSFRYVHDDVGNVSSRYAFVDGSRDRFSVGYEQPVEHGRLALGYVRERNDRIGPGVSPSRHEIFAGYEHMLNADWSVHVQGLLRSSRYGRLDEPREEDLSQLSFRATRDFVSGWQLLGEYRMAENASNAESFSYDRNRVVLSLSRLF